MEHCQRFLTNLKTPAEMRRMKSSEIDQPLYQKDLEADPAIVVGHNDEEKDDDVEHVDELDGTACSQSTSAFPAGKINFGNVGFVKFADEADESDSDSDKDLNENSAEMDDQEYVNCPVVRDVGVHSEAVLDLVQEDTLNTVQEDVLNTVQRDLLNTVPEDVINTVQMEIQNPVEGDEMVAEKSSDQVQEVDKNSAHKRKQTKKDREPKDAPNKKKRQSKPIKEVRKNIVKKAKGQVAKSDENAKKGFKSNFITIKLKLSTVHLKAGTTPDFALFVKDNVHSPDAIPPSQHAGKYLAFINGNLTKDFFSRGISYDPDQFYICQNEVDLKEDRQLPFKYSFVQNQNVQDEDNAENAESVSSLSEEDSEVEENSDDDAVNIFDMSAHAKRVSWGAPERENSESSQSSGGVLVHGRGAEKEVSKEKRIKKASNKKRAKESAAKTKNDILDDAGLNGDPGLSGQRGTTRGRGNGRGRGRGTSKGRGRGSKRSKK